MSIEIYVASNAAIEPGEINSDAEVVFINFLDKPECSCLGVYSSSMHAMRRICPDGHPHVGSFTVLLGDGRWFRARVSGGAGLIDVTPAMMCRPRPLDISFIEKQGFLIQGSEPQEPKESKELSSDWHDVGKDAEAQASSSSTEKDRASSMDITQSVKIGAQLAESKEELESSESESEIQAKTEPKVEGNTPAMIEVKEEAETKQSEPEPVETKQPEVKEKEKEEEEEPLEPTMVVVAGRIGGIHYLYGDMFTITFLCSRGYGAPDAVMVYARASKRRMDVETRKSFSKDLVRVPIEINRATGKHRVLVKHLKLDTLVFEISQENSLSDGRATEFNDKDLMVPGRLVVYSNDRFTIECANKEGMNRIVYGALVPHKAIAWTNDCRDDVYSWLIEGAYYADRLNTVYSGATKNGRPFVLSFNKDLVWI